MADFQTIGGSFRVRVHDGFHVAEYLIEAASEAAAHAEAAIRWRRGDDKQPHGGDPAAPVKPPMPVDVVRAVPADVADALAGPAPEQLSASEAASDSEAQSEQ